MTPLSVKRGVAAILVTLALVLQATSSVLAGTTGSITGTVVDAQSNTALAGARVTATSPSQTATTSSDSNGRFTFASLAPDTYSVTVAETSAYDSYSVSGVTVQADQSLTIPLRQAPVKQIIGRVRSVAASALVKPGTTADVYSISATQQDKASTFGGGGTLNSAWSAITSVPGVFVQSGQAGYIGANDGVSIRGGDYDQIGYEFDGIPVNRSFDNYPSGSLSSLGQQEVQVYTGAEPANAEAEGLSGFINQVIKSGTLPGYRSLDIATGAPSQYGKLAFEVGGATPSRNFSWYFGAGAYNQGFRNADQFNGADLSKLYGTPLAPCPNGTATPSCGSGFGDGTDFTNGGTTPAYALGPYSYAGGENANVGNVQSRDTVMNLHFGIPFKSGDRDDVQMLMDISHLTNGFNNSENDAGGPALLQSLGLATTYDDSYIFSGQKLGTVLPVTYTGGGITQYLMPGTPLGRAFNSSIPADANDSFVNNQGIFKLQYQHNFGTTAFLRGYIYTDYSDWLNQGPLDANTDFVGPVSPDYELNAHARGASIEFSDQLNSAHLLTLQSNYTTATTLRNNNFAYLNGVNIFGGIPSSVLSGNILPGNLAQLPVVGILVNGANPLSGKCYAPGGTAVPCYTPDGLGLNVGGFMSGGTAVPGFGFFTLADAANGTVTPATGTCGTGPCQYLVAQNGNFNEYNTVVPRFTSFSLTDNWQPTSKVTVNYGVRFDQFQFIGGNTCTVGGGPAREFFFAAYNAQFPNAALNNECQQTNTYDEIQPRIGTTLTLNPGTVVRASFGRYAQAPNTAFEQYNFLEPDSPIGFPAGLGQFYSFGLGNTPMHPIKPELSNNYDVSLERQLAPDLSVKISPFLRQTQNQIEEFYLNQQTNFVSGLNVGRQRSQGVEFELDKGDFSRNGFAAKLSFTYTNTYINYETAQGSNGPYSVLTGINAAITQYNSFTAKGGGAPCYTTAGAPVAIAAGCTTADVANPYYNAPAQPLLSLSANFPPYSLFPAGVGSFTLPTYGAPFVTTLLTQYKHNRFTITPALQIAGGQRYGAPLAANGIDPSSCTATTGLPAVQNSGIPQAPLYPYGGYGGAYSNSSCADDVVIPNPQTGRYDGIGAFVAPAALQLHVQFQYEATRRLTFVASFVNVYQDCFGGTKVPWSVAGACGYTEPIIGEASPIGNNYVAGDAIQPILKSEYMPTYQIFPFQAYFEARLKI